MIEEYYVSSLSYRYRTAVSYRIAHPHAPSATSHHFTSLKRSLPATALTRYSRLTVSACTSPHLALS